MPGDEPREGSVALGIPEPDAQHRLPRMRFVKRTVARFMPGESAEDAIEAASGPRRRRACPRRSPSSASTTPTSRRPARADRGVPRLLDRIQEIDLDAEVSVKLTQLGYDLDLAITRHAGAAPRRALGGARTHLLDRHGSRWATSTGTLDIYESLLVDGHDVGLCMQAYLRRTWDDMQRLLPQPPVDPAREGRLQGIARARLHRTRRDRRGYLRLGVHWRATPRAACAAPCSAPTTCRWSQRVEQGLGEAAATGSRWRCCTASAPDEQLRLAREGYAVRTLISFGDHWYPWFMRRLAEKPVENTLLALRNLV